MTIGDVRTGEKQDYAAQRVAAEELAARRELAVCLVALARHARDVTDFSELADAVSPVCIPEEKRPLLYRQLLDLPEQAEPVLLKEAEPVLLPEESADEIAWRTWEIVALSVRDQVDGILSGALLIVAGALISSGTEFSANTFLPLLPPGHEYLAGQVIQRLQRTGLQVTGSERSRLPSRRGSKVLVYRGAPASVR